MLESVSLKVFMFLAIDQVTSLLYVHETTKTCPDVDITPHKPPKIRREDISLIPLIFPRVNGPHSMLYAFTKSLLIRDFFKTRNLFT